MSDAAASTGLERILLELGSSGTGSAFEMIDFAAELAGALRAELAALFVEEEQLFDLSDLASIVAVRPGAEQVLQADRQIMEQAIVQQARLCRRALALKANAARLRWSFEAKRGDPLHLIQEAVGPSDILVLSGTAASGTVRANLEFARQITKAAAVLVGPPRPHNVHGTIAVIEDISQSTRDLVTFAQRLASALQEELVLLRVHWESAIAERGHLSQLTQSLMQRPISSEAMGILQLTSALQELKPRLLVSPIAGESREALEALAHLMRAARAPLLLVQISQSGVISAG